MKFNALYNAPNSKTSWHGSERVDSSDSLIKIELDKFKFIQIKYSDDKRDAERWDIYNRDKDNFNMDWRCVRGISMTFFLKKEDFDLVSSTYFFFDFGINIFPLNNRN